MMTQGKFTCIEDIETFWANVNEPDIYHQMFEAGGEVPDVEKILEEDARSQASDGSGKSS